MTKPECIEATVRFLKDGRFLPGDGRLVRESPREDPADYDVSTDRHLRIGFGSSDYFCGKIAEVRAYWRALTGSDVEKLFARKGHP